LPFPDRQRNGRNSVLTSSFTYDPFSELTSTTSGASATTSYTYDLDGNVTGITYPLGSSATWADGNTVTYTYDHADEMTAVEDFNGNTSDVTNNADGLPSALTLGGSGDTITTDYGSNDEPSSITLGGGSTLQEFSYSDVPSGGVASETDTPSSSLSPADYAYDAQSQVTADVPGTGSANDYSEDVSDNLTTLPTGAVGTDDRASELTSSTLSGVTTDYTYDASGDRTCESEGGASTMTATYNGAGEVASYSNSAASMSSATYDGDGLRTSATATPNGGSEATQNFVWNNTTSVPELLVDSTNAYIYGPNGMPFEQINISTGTIRYLVSDALGSVRGVVSSGGSLTASTSYDAWGNPETAGGLTAYTPFGFAGGYTDPTGLIYLVNRYYDPAAGQFLSVDPMVAETGQPYAYADDDPVNAIDPIGLDCGLFSFACSAYDSAAGGVKTAAKDTGQFVAEHHQVIEQVATVGGAIIGMAACDAATAGACSAFTPYVGALVGTAVYAEGGEQHTAEGYALAFASGGLVGSLSMVWGGVVTARVGLWAGDSAIGAGEGIYDYATGPGCQTFGGYLKAGITGASENAPIKLHWLFGQGEE
jgi:RHS repeat-associated protein